MNPIGDVKGFIIDVMRNIAIVFGIGYMGGTLVSLTHLDEQTIDKILPIDLNKLPYVGKKEDISLFGYGFPYTLYTPRPDFFQRVMNWLIMTSAFVFIGIRKLFRLIASIDTKELKYDLPLFYLAPFLLVLVAISASSMTRIFIMLIMIFSIGFGEYVLHKEEMKNGLWYFFAPVSFWYNSFSAPLDPGFINLILRLGISFLCGMLGFFAMTVFYPLWWSGIATFGLLYYIFFLFFSPFLEGYKGFNKIITELGNHRISLTILFMILTIWSSQTFLVPLATTGITVGSIYMLYLLFKNKSKK